MKGRNENHSYVTNNEPISCDGSHWLDHRQSMSVLPSMEVGWAETNRVIIVSFRRVISEYVVIRCVVILKRNKKNGARE